jgi:hypothetical protein
MTFLEALSTVGCEYQIVLEIEVLFSGRLTVVGYDPQRLKL